MNDSRNEPRSEPRNEPRNSSSIDEANAAEYRSDALSAEIARLERRTKILEFTNRELVEQLESTETAAMSVGPDYRIRWFTPTMAGLFDLTESEAGMHISQVCNVKTGAGLDDCLDCVFFSGEGIQDEMQCENGQWYLRRVLPNLPDPDSVIVTLTDITESKQQHEANQVEQEQLLAVMERRVEQRTAQLRVLSFELARSEERERRQVAVDLHDGLGQSLVLTKMKVGSLLDETEGEIAEKLAEIEALVDESSRSVRSLVRQLSPPALYDVGLIPAIEVLLEEMRNRYGLECDLDAEVYSGLIDEPIRVVLYRAVRELLINAARHASSSLVRTEISEFETDAGEHYIHVAVVDDGDGFDVDEVLSQPGSGFGINSINERLSYVGGEVEIDSTPGHGTRVSLIAPFRFIHER